MIRWPFSRKPIEPVLPHTVQAAELPSKELERQSEEFGLKLLGAVSDTMLISSRIRERLATDVINEVRGGRQ